MKIAERKKLELNIIRLTENLIQIVIDTSNNDWEIKKAVFLVRKLSEAVYRLIGDDEQLEKIIKQIAAQKLPESHVLTSFGSFTRDLDYIIKKGVQEFRILRRKKYEKKHKLAGKFILIGKSKFIKNNNKVLNKLSQSNSHLLKLLRYIFPNENIIFRYPFHNTFIQFYIPKKKLAIDIIDKEKHQYNGLKEYWCKKEDIKYIKLYSHNVNYLSLRNEIISKNIIGN